jgi:outer membrane biosynthesis protein TonB
MTCAPRLPALQRLIGALACACALLATGCGHKTMQSTPAVLVPSIESQPQPNTLPAPPAPEATTPAPTAPAPETTAQAPKPKPKPRKPAKPKPAPQPAPSEPAKTEPAKPAPGSNAQITADVPRAAVQSQRQSTENLLRASNDKLARVTRQLSDAEQGMMRQARNYIAQSNQALAAGDVERAYNLAVKASLLANELSK